LSPSTNCQQHFPLKDLALGAPSFASLAPFGLDFTRDDHDSNLHEAVLYATLSGYVPDR